MSTRTYLAPVFTRPVLATCLASDKRQAVADRARAVNDAYGPDASVQARYGSLKYIPTTHVKADPHGPLNRDGSEPRRRRWAMALRLTWTVFGLSEGSVYVPCYICGDVFDAWSLDADHVEPDSGAAVDNLLLACHGCNRGKHDVHSVHHVTRAWLTNMAAGLMVPRGSAPMVAFFRARWTRPDGRDMLALRPGEPAPEGWQPPLA